MQVFRGVKAIRQLLLVFKQIAQTTDFRDENGLRWLKWCLAAHFPKNTANVSRQPRCAYSEQCEEAPLSQSLA